MILDKLYFEGRSASLQGDTKTADSILSLESSLTAQGDSSPRRVVFGSRSDASGLRVQLQAKTESETAAKKLGQAIFESYIRAHKIQVGKPRLLVLPYDKRNVAIPLKAYLTPAFRRELENIFQKIGGEVDQNSWFHHTDWDKEHGIDMSFIFSPASDMVLLNSVLTAVADTSKLYKRALVFYEKDAPVFKVDLPFDEIFERRGEIGDGYTHSYGGCYSYFIGFRQRDGAGAMQRWMSCTSTTEDAEVGVVAPQSVINHVDTVRVEIARTSGVDE